jgi:glycosyltransferase involved in cell wall biosynthesis
MAARLSVCYAAPGHRLVATAGTTRNMLSLAEALGEFADVTLAFRHAAQREVAGRRVLTIEPGGGSGEAADDVAYRGLNPVAHLVYLRRLAAFAHDRDRSFDVVLEKGWRLSGTLLAAFRRRGVPGILVENDIRSWSGSIRDVRTLLKYAIHVAADATARRHRARLPIIAETEVLKGLLVERGAEEHRVEVIGLGVDHRLFQPRDQLEARRVLGIDRSVPVFVYVGAMDRYHNLSAVITALSTTAAPIELHVVGDGTRRAECQRLADHLGAPVRFHGRVAHERVPTYIAAADACVSAYQEQEFPGGAVPFSTLKVAEYMACARPVVGNAAGEARSRLENGISAFLFANDVASWTSFFSALPGREQLAEMGRAAAKAAESLSWEYTASRYFEVCARVATEGGRR